MKFILATIAVLALMSVLVACFKKGSAEVKSVSPMEAFGALRNGFAVLVDVREKDEIQTGLAEPAQWIATSEIERNSPAWQEFVKGLPKDKDIILYCAAGGRSARAAANLKAQGFRTANMGGYRDWVGAGLPTKKP